MAPFTSSTVYLAKMRKFIYPTEPPPSSTLHHGKIIKILKRNVYPTVILPIDDKDVEFLINGDETSNNDEGIIATSPTDTNSKNRIDHYFMGMALQQARYAQRKGEVPIGAVIVKECTAGDGDDDYYSRTGRVASSSSSSLSTSPSTTAQSTIQTRRTYQILSAGHNQVETTMDASAHAELVALRQGAKTIKNWRYPPSTTLYSTLEPCPICLASIQAFRIDHVVYGAHDHRLGAITSHMELLNVAKHPYHEVKSSRGGIRETECGEIVKHFFRERRRVNKMQKANNDCVDKDERQHHMLKLPRQTKKSPRKNDYKTKEPFLTQHQKKDTMNGRTEDGQRKLLKVPRLRRKQLRNYNPKGVIVLLNFMKALLG